MKFSVLATLLVITILHGCGSKNTNSQMQWYKYVSPEDAGWDTTILKEAIAYSNTIGSAGVVIVQGDKIVTSWGNVDEPLKSYSVRKSLMSLLIGNNLKASINLNSTINELGLDDKQKLSNQVNSECEMK